MLGVRSIALLGHVKPNGLSVFEVGQAKQNLPNAWVLPGVYIDMLIRAPLVALLEPYL